VGKESIKIDKVFKVKGLSVNGKVLLKKGGKGVEGDVILMEGKKGSVKKEDGS
jgi:predicted aconitase with swiveling domain